MEGPPTSAASPAGGSGFARKVNTDWEAGRCDLAEQGGYHQVMFERSARFYDALYSWKDYEREATRLHELIQRASPRAHRLLDVACGTGKHLGLLRAHYDVEGLEVASDFVDIARERLPEVTIHEADMRNFHLGKTFDVVTCLFSSIGYATTLDELMNGVQTMCNHVAEKGLLIVEPWLTPEAFQTGNPWAVFVDEPGLKIARMDVPEVDGRVSVITFHYLVASPEGVEHFTEIHRLGLFTHEEYIDAFEKAGLDFEHDSEGLMGRGLYVGQRTR